MQIETFRLERFFARHEFTAPRTLTSSDCEPLTLAEALALADAEGREYWEGLSLGYTEYAGSTRLLAEIAGHYETVSAGDLHVAAPIECIFLALNAMLRPGEHAICAWPGYQALRSVADAIGCEVEVWEPEESPGWRFDVERLLGMLRPDTRAVIINFPHNPTGATMTGEEFAAVVEAVRERGAYLFSDEMYRLLELEEGDRLPPACDRYERAVSMSGMSKAFGMPGVRIGWLACRDRELMEGVARLRDYTTICSSAPGEALAFIGLRASRRLVARNMRRIRRNVEALDRFFERFGELLAWGRPSGGTVSFPRLLSQESSAGFCSRVLDDTGILLVPSRAFDYGDAHFRLGFGREDMPEVLDALADYLDRKPTG